MSQKRTDLNSKSVSWDVLSFALRAETRANKLSVDLERQRSSLTFGLGQIFVDILRYPLKAVPGAFQRLKRLKDWRAYRTIFEQIDVVGFPAPKSDWDTNTYSGARTLLYTLRSGPMEMRKKALNGELKQNSEVSELVAAAYRLAAKTLTIPEDFDDWAKSQITPKRDGTPTAGSHIYMCLAQSILTHENGYAHRSHEILNRLATRSRDVTALQFSPVLSGFKGELDDVIYELADHPFEEYTDPLSYLASIADALEAKLNGKPVSCLHAASNFKTGLPAALVSMRLNVPFIYEVRGFWELSRAANDPSFQGSIGYEAQIFLEIQTALLADHVIALSAPIADELVSRGVPAEKISIARNGASIQPVTQMSGSKRPLTIGFIGSLTSYEGLNTLVEALKIIDMDRFSIAVRIIGVGPYSEVLSEKIRKAGLTKSVKMLGRLPHADIGEAYDKIDVVYSGRNNRDVGRIVSPMKPLEALSYGKPILASDLPALVDLLETGDHVMYVSPDNPPALANMIEKISSWSPEERAKRHGAAKDWVRQNRSWDETVDVIEAVYNDCL